MDIVDTDDSAIDVMSEAISNGKICHLNLDRVTSQIRQFNASETDNGTTSNGKVNADNKVAKIYEWIANEDMESNEKKTECCDSQDYPRSSLDQFCILVKRMLRQRTRNTVSKTTQTLNTSACRILSITYPI